MIFEKYIYGICGAAISAALFWFVVIPLERSDARNGYVVESRAITAEAKSEELKRQLAATQIVIQSYQEIQKNDEAKDKLAAADAEARIQQYVAMLRASGQSCGITQSTIDFLRDK